MAEVLGTALLGAAIGQLLKAITDFVNRTSDFNSRLEKLKKDLEAWKPICEDLEVLYAKLDRYKEIEQFATILNKCTVMVKKGTNMSCLKFWSKEKFSKDLKELEDSISNFLTLHLSLNTNKTVLELCFMLRQKNERIDMVFNEQAKIISQSAPHGKPIPHFELCDKDAIYQVHLKSLYLNKYVSAENDGGSLLVANKDSASHWETFCLWRVNETNFYMRVFNKKFIGIDNDGDGTRITTNDTPQLLNICKNPDGGNLVRIRSSNGKFLQTKTQDLVTADNMNVESQWGDNDPSVFKLCDKDAIYQVKLKSVYLNKYVCTERSGASLLVANGAASDSDWETLSLWRVNEKDFYMKVLNKQFIGYDINGDGTRMMTYATSANTPQLLNIYKNSAGGNLVRIRSSNGKFLQAKTQDLITIDNTNAESQWGDDDPSVFELSYKDAIYQVHLKSLYFNKYVSAENGGASVLIANRNNTYSWETFSLWRVNETDFYMRVFNKEFIGYDSDGDGTKMLTSNTSASSPPLLNILKNPTGGNRVRIRSSNEKFLQAKTPDLVTFDNLNVGCDPWEDNDPSVFELHLKDDIYRVQLKSLYWNKYVCAENGGASNLVANRESGSDWETFSLWRAKEVNYFYMRVFNNRFIGYDSDGDGTRMLTYATFGSFANLLSIWKNPDGGNQVRILSSNGKFLQAKTKDLVTADNTNTTSLWKSNDPSVFELIFTKRMQVIDDLFYNFDMI